jgi:hypothetical protein
MTNLPKNRLRKSGVIPTREEENQKVEIKNNRLDIFSTLKETSCKLKIRLFTKTLSY